MFDKVIPVVLLFSASTEFTTDMYPMLSMTKISPCFADILVPSEVYPFGLIVLNDCRLIVPLVLLLRFRLGAKVQSS